MRAASAQPTIKMSMDYRMKNIFQEMEEGHGVFRKQVEVWKETYQSWLELWVKCEDKGPSLRSRVKNYTAWIKANMEK